MSGDVRSARLGRLWQVLDAERLDGLLITHLPNVRYLTGFTGSAGVVVIWGDQVMFFTDFRYRTQARDEVDGAARVEIVDTDVWNRVWEVLRERPVTGRLGFESHVVTVQQAERFARAGLGCRFEPVRDLVERLRVRKEPGEVEAIRRAAALALEAFQAVLPGIRPGLTELEIGARLEGELRRRGSEWHPFPTIVASGPRAALPHAGTGRRSVQAGDLLLLDFGAQLDGYCADLTRTVVVGRADERQRMVYDLVREAQIAARERIRAGMTGKEADALARSVIEARGFGDSFGHSLGHGLGLEVHEAPRVSRSNTDPLPEHAVVTIEPGVYLPGWGGVRIEDDVYLGPDVPEVLSGGDTQLVEIRD